MRRGSRIHTGEALLRKILTHVQVDPLTECWNWTRGFSQSGYRGVFYPAIRTLTGDRYWLWRGGRLVLTLYLGPTEHPQAPGELWAVYLERLRIAYQGLEASHACDNSRCLNPDHLGWRGHGVNIQEQVERRRARARERGQEQEQEPSQQEVA